MANYFDQFDEPAAPQSPAATGGNYFDQFDEKPAPAGVGMNFTAGLNEGVYNTLGAPVDAAAWVLNQGIRGVNALAGTDINPITHPLGGSRSIAQGFGAIGVPDPETVQASTVGERVARGAGQGAGYMIAPELAVRGAAQAVGRQVGPVMGSLFGNSADAGALAGNAVAGGAAGAGGQVAGQMVPEPYRPLAELGGNLVGGGIGAVAVGAPRMAVEGVRRGMDFAAPLTGSGQERMAGNMLRDAASSPGTAQDALEAGPSSARARLGAHDIPADGRYGPRLS